MLQKVLKATSMIYVLRMKHLKHGHIFNHGHTSLDSGNVAHPRMHHTNSALKGSFCPSDIRQGKSSNQRTNTHTREDLSDDVLPREQLTNFYADSNASHLDSQGDFKLQKSCVQRVPGLTIRDCARSVNNLASASGAPS